MAGRFPKDFRDDVIRLARDRGLGETLEKIANDFDAHPLESIRPRDVVGSTRRRVAADDLANRLAIEKKVKALTVEITVIVTARCSNLMKLPGVGPVVAARILAAVGDVLDSPTATGPSWTGTAPFDASSGQQTRHRLSRAGTAG